MKDTLWRPVVAFCLVGQTIGLALLTLRVGHLEESVLLVQQRASRLFSLIESNVEILVAHGRILAANERSISVILDFMLGVP